MYRNGKSTSQIAAHYYELGIPSRQGGRFYTKFISDILKNKIYLGILVWNRKHYDMKEKTKNGEGKQCYVEQLAEKEKLLNKNLEKQKGLYEVFSEDKINLDIYKEKTDLLRNEEKRLKSEIKAIQLKILDSRNSINITKETQDFLLRLKSTPKEEQSDYAIKTFMRIIFKGIYVYNQEIVKVEINQPWKLCYDKELQCLERQETE